MSIITDGTLGLAIADAVGVPAEFKSRQQLRTHPITDMTGFGSHNQPAGFWSDDSSMMLATMDSLTQKHDSYDPDDIMQKFCAWYFDDAYTPDNYTFDAGGVVGAALQRYRTGTPALDCGGKDKYDNGNGSLMRILPMVFYQFARFNRFLTNDRPALLNPLSEVSGLTHAHPISLIGCGIYAQIIATMIRFRQDNGILPDISGTNAALRSQINQAIGTAWNDFEHNGYGNIYDSGSFKEDTAVYSRLRDVDKFAKTNENEINSSGYVVDTLEAALWCFLTTDNYRDCVLKAVNLGKDTDTVAAVAGSFAGITYGTEGMPQHWIEQLARREWLLDLCRKFEDSLPSKI